jgi:beta-galactosidase
MGIIKKFTINGKPEVIVSGAIHYFRTPHQLWEDRIIKAKRCGLNTIETYVAWNFHECEEGKFDFSGDKDIDKFFKLCEKHGLYILVRPGPYICSEWDNGGLPAWLNIKKDIKLRTYNKIYLKYVDKWFDKFIPIICDHQIEKGGRVILVQVENEYFYPYREDGKKYLEYLRNGLRNRGVTTPLVQCNSHAQPIDGIIETLNVGTDGIYENLAKIYIEKNSKNPLLITEFWDGWFDSWSSKPQKKTAESLRNSLEKIISAGWNYNYYMFHGGTNFGFWGGRSIGNEKIFITTSYDFDAPLSESGEITDKYLACRELNYRARNAECPELHLPEKGKQEIIPLENWEKYQIEFDKWQKISEPKSVEELKCYLGYVWYKLEFDNKNDETKTIWFPNATDRIKIYHNFKYAGTYGIGENATIFPIKINLNKGKNTFLFLADNMGRFCVGAKLGETKGIKRPVYSESSNVEVKWEIKKTEEIKIDNNENLNNEYVMGDKKAENTKDIKDWLIPDLNSYYMRTEFNMEEGESYYIDYRGFDNDLSIWVNNKQVFYSLRIFLASGFDRIKIDSFIKSGKNLIEIYYKDMDEQRLSKNIFLIKYKISSELKGNWFFQPFKTNYIKHKPDNMDDLPAFWTTKFQLKNIKQPVKLLIDGLQKGQIYLNNYNIGRYWQTGIQKEYYLPEPWLNLNWENSLVIFEEENKTPEKTKLIY